MTDQNPLIFERVCDGQIDSIFALQLFALTLWFVGLDFAAFLAYLFSCFFVLFFTETTKYDWPSCLGDFTTCDETGFCPDVILCELAERNEREDEGLDSYDSYDGPDYEQPIDSPADYLGPDARDDREERECD